LLSRISWLALFGLPPQASLSLKIGTERAARRATVELGADVAATAVPRLAPAYLSGAINSYSPASTISTDLSTFLE